MSLSAFTPRLAAALLFACGSAAETVSVVLPAAASTPERIAAAELAGYLKKTYPRNRFSIATAPPKRGKAILLGPSAIAAGVTPPAEPEAFAAGTVGGHGFLVGGSPRGLLHGVYALLEKLGWGFYLSYEAAPPPRPEPLDFSGWRLEDHPVCRDRVVFQWHNFLSSASTWEDEDWRRWIDGASRMRFNTVMIHAYGNNPMFTFTHNGQAKPAGYLATTRKGRDWGTQHVNDVRRMAGGHIFTSAEFGSSAAIVSEDRRVEAAQAMTRRALDYARSRALHVAFALDIDTESANPRNIILTLPETARFRSGAFWLPDPDTAEGYA